MKHITRIQITLVTALITAGSFQSCRKGGPWGIRGQGEQITETRDLKNFNAIDLSIDADVVYKLDSVYKVEITAQRNILAIMEAKISGGELEFDFRRNVHRHDGISIVIHSPSLREIDVSGSGNVDVVNSIQGTELEMNVSGSGNISVQSVSVQALQANISGSGNIKVNGGNCKDVDFKISGAGNISAQYVEAVNATARISGAGNISLYATEKLKATISGSGNIKYRGRPVIDSNISGTGKLIPLD